MSLLPSIAGCSLALLATVSTGKGFAHAIIIPTSADPTSTRDDFFRRVYSRSAKGAAVGASLASVLAQPAAASVPPSVGETSGALFAQSPSFSSIESELDSKSVGWSLPTEHNRAANDADAAEPSVRWSDLRYGASTLSDRSRVPSATTDPPAEFPPWLAGTWSTRMKFAGATFPQGRSILTLRVPGAGLGTCLSLPNVGFNPALFPWRFSTGAAKGGSLDEAGAAYEDLAYSCPRRFEAFWPESKVDSVRVGLPPNNKGSAAPDSGLAPRCYVTGEGCSADDNPDLHGPSTRVAMEFTGPTRRGGRVTQTVDVSAIRSSSGSVATDGKVAKFAVTRQYTQNNAEQDLQTFYREVLSLAPVGGSDNEEVSGKLRVAAFLPKEVLAQTAHDDRYAVAIYDYKVFLTSITEEDAASM